MLVVWSGLLFLYAAWSWWRRYVTWRDGTSITTSVKLSASWRRAVRVSNGWSRGDELGGGHIDWALIGAFLPGALLGALWKLCISGFAIRRSYLNDWHCLSCIYLGDLSSPKLVFGEMGKPLWRVLLPRLLRYLLVATRSLGSSIC